MGDHGAPIHPGVIINGKVFPEPVRVVFGQSIADTLKIGGQGLRTEQYHRRLLTPDRLAFLKVLPSETPYFFPRGDVRHGECTLGRRKRY